MPSKRGRRSAEAIADRSALGDLYRLREAAEREAAARPAPPVSDAASSAPTRTGPEAVPPALARPGAVNPALAPVRWSGSDAVDPALGSDRPERSERSEAVCPAPTPAVVGRANKCPRVHIDLDEL